MTVGAAPEIAEVRHSKIAGGSYRANSQAPAPAPALAPIPVPAPAPVGTTHYETLGAGYCRDDGLHRPDGYYIPLEELSVNERSTTLLRTSTRRMNRERLSLDGATSPRHLACAVHCSHDSLCIAFAIDPDMCTIYTV